MGEGWDRPLLGERWGAGCQPGRVCGCEGEGVHSASPTNTL